MISPAPKAEMGAGHRSLFVRLPAEQVEQLKERARTDARTLSATVRLAVEAYLRDGAQ